MNENQNLTIKVKLSTNMEGSTYGVATIIIKSSIGMVKITGFRIAKSKYSTDILPPNIDISPPSFANRAGRFSPIFFLEPDNPELSKQKWLKLKKLIYDAYAKERQENPIEDKELDIDEIAKGVDEMNKEDAFNL